MKLSDSYSHACKRCREVGFPNLPELEQWVLAIVEFQDEVNGGGLDPYFFNSSGDHVPVLLGALAAIGAVEARDLIVEALTVFDSVGGYTTGQDARIARFNQLDQDACAERFTPLNRRLQEMTGKIGDQLEAYVNHQARNPDAGSRRSP